MLPHAWEWLGEPLAIDFANTVRRRGREYEDLLRAPADLEEWARRERLPGVDAGRRLAEARELRDAVLAVLRAATADERPPAAAAEQVNRAARRVRLVPQLRDGGVELTALDAPDPLDEALARIALSTLEVVGHPGLALCDAPSCGQLFLRHRADQLWCGPACGTRARVARHAAQRRP